MALVEAEKQFEREGRKFSIITQNVDSKSSFHNIFHQIVHFFMSKIGLHLRAGSRNLIEMHGKS